MSEASHDITQLLHAHGKGQDGAFDDLMALVYDDLRRIARRQLRRRPGNTLNTTGLVHEAYMKMVDQTRASFQDRSHFFAISAHAMRQIIVDHARQRLAAKRGGGLHHTEVKENQAAVDQQADRVLAVDDALGRLGDLDERLVKLIECRFFAGYTEEETAEALGVSLRTAQRDWKRARAWLKVEMGG
jgi:RNA polymerase sigma factor (TIGR02999 family)